MKFGERIAMIRNALYVTPRYEAWLEQNPNAVYSEKAKALATQELGKGDRERRKTVSASSLGTCMRSQLFTFLGIPRVPFQPRTINILHNGTFMHLRWQMALMTAGILAQAEVPMPKNDYRLSGTADGVLDDGSILELKSTNDNSFRKVIQFGPLPGHEDQIATYVALTGAERGIFIYENKNTQEYKEIIRKREELPIQQVLAKAVVLWEFIENKELPPPLDAVYEPKMPCKYCAFLDVCPKIESWAHAEEIVDGLR